LSNARTAMARFLRIFFDTHSLNCDARCAVSSGLDEWTCSCDKEYVDDLLALVATEERAEFLDSIYKKETTT